MFDIKLMLQVKSLGDSEYLPLIQLLADMTSGVVRPTHRLKTLFSGEFVFWWGKDSPLKAMIPNVHGLPVGLLQAYL